MGPKTFLAALMCLIIVALMCSPIFLVSRRPIWAGARGDISLVGPGTPRSRNADTCDEHLMSITKLNDEVASLNAQLKTCKINFDPLKFARDAYTVGRL